MGVAVAGPVFERVDVTVDTAFADRNFDGVGGVVGVDFNVRDDGGIPGNWLIWDEVTPTAGQLTIQVAAVSPLNGDRPHLNAIRITPALQGAVPVPGWAALATGISLLLGSAWLLAKRSEIGRRPGNHPGSAPRTR